MYEVGIICDLEYERHHLFRSYYHTVKNIYGEVGIVKDIHDLGKVERLLFIGDDHYGPHKQIWMTDEFIQYCNDHEIHVVALTNERILDSYFPWNAVIQGKLSKFKHLTHYTNDVDDCRKLGLKVNRTAMSRSIPFSKYLGDKMDRAVFIGNTRCKSYRERVGVIERVQRFLPLDIISDIPSWGQYMRILGKYRFVFSPIGNGNFFPMRFYEALVVGSIPIHQVRQDTLDYYTMEKEFDDCIFFETLNELEEKLHKFTLEQSHNVIWMEDNLIPLLKEDSLI